MNTYKDVIKISLEAKPLQTNNLTAAVFTLILIRTMLSFLVQSTFLDWYILCDPVRALSEVYVFLSLRIIGKYRYFIVADYWILC